MTIKVAINGFGRMGRLACRAAWGFDPTKPATLAMPSGAWGNDFEIVHINEPNGTAEMSAHLLKFDSVFGQWPIDVAADGSDAIRIGDKRVTYSQVSTPADIPVDTLGVDLIMESSGKFKTAEALAPYYDMGARKVVVAAPVKGDALNIVMGVNDDMYEPDQHHLVTAASCTTNCLAPVVKVIHEGLGIKHGMITTIHDVTNTQTLHDKPMKDMRRARSGLLNLIPTSTGSATAITMIFPELQGKLDGVAVRVPLLNASITDCVFEVARHTTIDEVNGLLRDASVGSLQGILGFEDRPLVSTDFSGDPRSSIIDGPSTMVTDGSQIKILAWYDNEFGYANRWVDLTGKVARSVS